MKDASLRAEIVVSLLMIGLLVVFLNPFNILMTPMVAATIIAGLIATFALFAVFFWHEQSRDEREHIHRLTAGRIAFLTGTSLLVLGIVYQTTQHTLDPWLVATLGVMIIAKLAGIVYARLKQ